jgi:serralysin
MLFRHHMSSNARSGGLPSLSLVRNLRFFGHALSGNNIMHGRGGNDRLISGSGSDVMTGARGRDVFIFKQASDSKPSARDRITVFTSGQDRLDFRDFDTGLRGVDLLLIGSSSFSGRPGELRFSNGRLLADLNGNRRSNFSVDIDRVYSLSASDFLL